MRNQTSFAVKAADADFLLRKEEFENGTIRGAMSSTARQHADFFYELSDTARARYGVDEQFRNTAFGWIAETSGDMIATSALMAAGSLTMAEKLGKAASVGQKIMKSVVKSSVNVAGTGRLYAGVTKEREEFLGERYANEGWSFAQDIVNAGGQQAIEMIPFLDNALEKALRFAPKVNGRVSLGEALRQFPKIAAHSGAVEAAEGVSQKVWSDFIRDQGYDDTWVDLDNEKMKYAKALGIEAFANFAGGVMMAGLMQGPLIYDQNNRAKKAERMLTAKDGGLYSARDFQLLREARSDEEIGSMAMGDILLKAVNGDVAAMKEYNKEAAKQAFKQVDGLDLVDGKLGEVDGKPAFLSNTGDVFIFDTTNAEAAAKWDKIKELAVRWNDKKAMDGVQGEQATSEMVSYISQLQSERGGLFSIDVGVKARSILEQVDGNEERAQKLVDNYVKAGALPVGTTINSIVQGTSSTKFDKKTRKFVTAIQIAQGASPLVVLEESAHDYFKRQIKLNNFSEATVNDWRRQVEAGWEGNMGYTELHEWLAKYAVGYAMGKVQAGEISTLPSSFRRYLDRFAQFFRESLEFAAKVMQMEKDNVLPADFLLALQEATGLDRARVNRNRRGMELESVFAQLPPEAQMVAEAAQQALLDFEKLKNEYRQQEALQMQAAINDDRQADAAIAQGLEERMRALDFARAKAETAIDEAMNLPASTQLSAQAQAALDEWETYSIDALAATDEEMTFSINVTVAPVRRDSLSELNKTEVKKRTGSAKFIHLQQVASDVAEAYGVTVLGRQPIVGGWNVNGTTTLEVPEVITFDTDDVALAEEMAGLIAASAPELQNGALVWKNDDNGKDHVIYFKAVSAKAALETAEDLNKAGVKGFSYDIKDRQFSLVLKGITDEDLSKVYDYIRSKTEQGSLSSKSGIKAGKGTAEFPSEGDYRKYIESARSRADQIGGEQGNAIREVALRAERRVTRYEGALKISEQAKEIIATLPVPTIQRGQAEKR